MDHFATAVEELEQHRSSPEDHEMASAPTGERTDMRQPRGSSSEDATMTSAAHNSRGTTPFPYPSQQNWIQSHQQQVFNSFQQRPVNYYHAPSHYPLLNPVPRSYPSPQAAPPPLRVSNNLTTLRYGQPQRPGQMPPPQFQQRSARAIDPFEPLSSHLTNEPNHPFTPANLATLPTFLKERGTATFSLPGSLLHVAGLLYPGATFTVTLATANVPMRLGGDGLAKFSQLLPPAARNEKYHLHLVFRDWPAGQVAEFPDDAVARQYVERMEAVISPMPGHEVWYYDRFFKVADDRFGEYETGERCFRVLRGFRGHGMGAASGEEVLGWMRRREGRVPVDESGGRVIEFATGLYFALGNQRITGGRECGDGDGGGRGSIIAGAVEESDVFQRDEEEGDGNTSKVGESTAKERKASTSRGKYTKRRKSSASQASKVTPAVTALTAGISAIVAAPAQVEQKVLREGLRPRSGQPANYATPWWTEKKKGRLVVDLDAPEDERLVEVKEEDTEEEAEEEIEDEVIAKFPLPDDIYGYDP
ncbi:hypothetical protein B0T18DRAFT_474245 [Schizothecium vesticola]|uniref:Uncharacterized protein n=1 Tax=Schizothecium vesticola TaxID=314040 RepID=A0AA40EFP2_9PEZI|nr:hypothetical protein B0T18DRAFT_474245 [Schizothecium vesticola]